MKESGIGRENGMEAYLACTFFFKKVFIRILMIGLFSLPSRGTDTQSKSTIVNIASPEVMRGCDDWFADLDEERRYG